MSRISVPSDVPALIYSMLRDVHASRTYRIGREAGDLDVVVLYLTDLQIFSCMPDYMHLNWAKEAQPALIEATLANMEILQRGATQPGVL